MPPKIMRGGSESIEATYLPSLDTTTFHGTTTTVQLKSEPNSTTTLAFDKAPKNSLTQILLLFGLFLWVTFSLLLLKILWRGQHELTLLFQRLNTLTLNLYQNDVYFMSKPAVREVPFNVSSFHLLQSYGKNSIINNHCQINCNNCFFTVHLFEVFPPNDSFSLGRCGLPMSIP